MSAHEELKKDLKKIIDGLDAFLAQHVRSGHFNERSFYGESFYAAALKILDRRPQLQRALFEYYFDENITHDTHPEFNAYAWQYFLRDSPTTEQRVWLRKIAFKQLFLRKASNWVLLRSLVRVRSGGERKYIGLMQAYLILLINRYRGFITDNTLRMVYKRQASLSSQYHAFATSLVGELFTETNHSFFRKTFIQCADLLLMDQKNGDFNWRGRGKKQLFGYASAIRCFHLAYILTDQDKYLDALLEILVQLKQFQKNTGEIPLALMRSHQKLYWQSYNNRYDYLGFLIFQLSYTFRNLKSI